MRRFVLLFVAPPLLVLGLVVLPLLLGQRTLYLRDVMNAHLPLKAAQAEALRQGELPLIDPHRGGGMPQLGNPNGLPLYPDNLLLLAADPLWVVNAHFWIHWLLAPFAFFWLGRQLGLERTGAWVAGVLFASGGYFFSLLNFYNLVAVGTLAPAFLAAVLAATRPPGPDAARTRWRWPRVGLLFCLLLLAGDPYSVLLVLLLLALALGLRDGVRALRSARELAGALVLGFLATLPMWVEMLRILPVSTRVAMSGQRDEALGNSLSPLHLIEGFFPLFFGRFDFSFWGARVYDVGQPFFVSLFPGLLAFALLPLALRRGDGGLAWLFGWAAGALGLFGALGHFNPVMVLLYQLPGFGTLRFPVKFLLLSAVGLAVLGGLAADRLVASGRWNGVRLVLLAALAAYGAFFALVLLQPATIAGLLLRFDPGLPGALLEMQPGRLGATALVLAAATGAMLVATLLARRAPRGALALLLFLQVGIQCNVLESLIESDEAAFYRARPSLDAALPAQARIVHAAFIPETFGELKVDPRNLPDLRSLWRARCNHEGLASPTGIYLGRRYELNFTPEGLDTFYGYSFGVGLRPRSDAERVRGLAAAGVDLIVLPRPLVGVPPEDATLLQEFATTCRDPLRIYRVERPLPPLALLSEIGRAPSAAQAVEATLDPGFDPRRMAVLAGGPAAGAGVAAPPGAIVDSSEGIDWVTATVDSAKGGVVATRRAFLPLYRAEIDGRPAAPVLVNGHRLGVEVPAGRHEVRLFVDRRPTRAAFAVAALAWTALLVWALRTRAAAAG